MPDPATAGPSFIQIATEGGWLPKPVVIPNQPVTWNMDPTNFNFGNVLEHSLVLGTAERADVIVDFSAYAGKTLILYNDAPAAYPARVSTYDYYTGSLDLTSSGGAPVTQPGYGPNTRTIMQIRVSATPQPQSPQPLGSVTVVSSGTGYTAPVVTIDPPTTVGGVQATATATLGKGEITGITVLSDGYGYICSHRYYYRSDRDRSHGLRHPD